MKRIKRILAITGVVLLVLLYLITLHVPIPRQRYLHGACPDPAMGLYSNLPSGKEKKRKRTRRDAAAPGSGKKQKIKTVGTVLYQRFLMQRSLLWESI